MKLREIFFTFFSAIFLISVLLLGGCAGSGGEEGNGGGSGTIRLEWDAPTTNTDGSPLTDLGGYYVYYGTASGIYGIPKDAGMGIPNGNKTTYTLSGLTPGQTYYIVVKAYDTSGNISDPSNQESGVAK